MWIRFIDPRSSSPGIPNTDTSPFVLLVLEKGPAADLARQAIRTRPGSAEADRRALYRKKAEPFTRNFADFMAGLSRANAGLEWWAMALSGKNPMSAQLPRRAFQFSLIVEQVAGAPDGAGLLVVSSDRALAQQVRLWARGKDISAACQLPRLPTFKEALGRWTPLVPFFNIARALWRLVLVRMKLSFTAEPDRPRAVLFTLLSPRSFGPDGRYRDMFFGDLVSILEARGESPLVFGAAPSSLGSVLDRMGAGCGSPPVVPMDLFLSWKDILWVFGMALRRRLCDFPLQGDFHLRGLDVGLLVQEELRDNARTSRLFWDLWFHACARALLRRLRVQTLYYPFENYSRERAFLLAFRALSPKTHLVGYQHAAMTPNHLNFMLGRGESDTLPLPDRIVTLGEVTRDRLRDWGRFPPALLRVGCALRQDFKGVPAAGSAAPRGDSPLRLLVTLATSVEECAGVLRLLDRTFGGSAEGCPEITLRPHPLFPIAAGLRLSGPVRFPYRDGSGRPAAEAFAGADAVLYVSSTMGVEALAWGLPAVCLDLGDWLSIDPVLGFQDLKWTASDPGSLRRALAEIAALAPEQLAARRAAAQAYARRYFHAPSDESLQAFFPGGTS